MLDTGFATLLGVTSLYPNMQTIEFSYPFDNGIRAIGWDDIISGEDRVYYGDEIDLRFWKLLRMPFGKIVSALNELTNQEIFHDWAVFTCNATGGAWNNPSSSDQSAAASSYSFNVENDAIICNRNNDSFSAFISQDVYAPNFTIDYIIDNRILNRVAPWAVGDDDGVFFIVGFMQDSNGDYHTISVVRIGDTEGGHGTRFAIAYDLFSSWLSYSGSTMKILATDNTLVQHDWDGNSYAKLQVQKSTTGIVAKTSQINSDEFAVTLTYTLPSTKPSDMTQEQYDNIKYMLENDTKIGFGTESNASAFRMTSASGSISCLTLQEGYLYKYYHTTRIFDVYNNLGTRIIHKTNIRNIAQMNIDFTIANSHQFWIIAGVGGSGFSFMFPARLKAKTYPSDIETYLEGGVQNIYLPDRVRPYLPQDFDNPEWFIKHLATYGDLNNPSWVNGGGLEMRKYITSVITGIGKYEAIDWFKNCPTNYFYMKELYELEVCNLPDNIVEVEPFDPTKPYKPGDFVRGDGGGSGPGLPPNVLYKVLGDSCQKVDEYGNYYNDPNRFIYTIKNTSRIFDFKLGKTYYVNDIIRIIEDGMDVFYLVKSEFIATDWSVDIIYTQKICTLLIEVKRFKSFTFFAEKLWLLYMQLGIGLYPALMPIQRYDETQNNRPIYEPWLIWGFYNFLWNKKTTDWGDDIEIPLFDLSPSFA